MSFKTFVSILIIFYSCSTLRRVSAMTSSTFDSNELNKICRLPEDSDEEQQSYLDHTMDEICHKVALKGQAAITHPSKSQITGECQTLRVQFEDGPKNRMLLLCEIGPNTRKCVSAAEESKGNVVIEYAFNQQNDVEWCSLLGTVNL